MNPGEVRGGATCQDFFFCNKYKTNSMNTIFFEIIIIPLESHKFPLFNDVLRSHVWWVSWYIPCTFAQFSTALVVVFQCRMMQECWCLNCVILLDSSLNCGAFGLNLAPYLPWCARFNQISHLPAPSWHLHCWN